MSDQPYAGATSETAQTWKTIHTKHTLSHPNKVMLFNLEFSSSRLLQEIFSLQCFSYSILSSRDFLKLSFSRRQILEFGLSRVAGHDRYFGQTGNFEGMAPESNNNEYYYFCESVQYPNVVNECCM